ncbi:MAG: hypothetical protein E6I75_30490, partial [Chloroflexi bacterium]
MRPVLAPAPHAGATWRIHAQASPYCRNRRLSPPIGRRRASHGAQSGQHRVQQVQRNDRGAAPGAEMGQLLALKAWYCDSTHRYELTDAAQPLIVRSGPA